MVAKSSQKSTAMMMTVIWLVPVYASSAQKPFGQSNSSDSSNGDASHNKIHECDDSQSREAKLGSITKRRDRSTPSRRRLLGTRLVAIPAAAPKFSSHGYR